MKKILMGLIISTMFTSTMVMAKSKTSDIVMLGFGQQSASIEDVEGYGDVSGSLGNFYSLSYYYDKGKNPGVAYNLEYFNETESGTISGIGDVSATLTLIQPSVGVILGATDHVYISPSFGLSYLKSELKTDDYSGAETDWGWNIGADVLYKTDLGLVLGVGARYSMLEVVNFYNLQFKVGMSF